MPSLSMITMAPVTFEIAMVSWVSESVSLAVCRLNRLLYASPPGKTTTSVAKETPEDALISAAKLSASISTAPVKFKKLV